MLRKLFALLVLVTGLAAVGQPAQALSLDVQSVRAADASYACVAPAGARQGVSSGKEREEAEPKTCPRPPRIVVIVPTVMLQADRARE